MNRKILFPVFLIGLLITFNSCKTNFDEPKFTSGTADFSRYVALGNSLTSGYQDNALCEQGQANAYPSILHQQFTKAGGGADFLVPYLTGDDATLGVSPAPQWPSNPFRTVPALVLGYETDCNGVSNLTPVLRAAANINNTNFYTNLIGANGKHFGNLGVPGARSYDLTQQTFGEVLLGGNPYYQRFASNPGVSTVVQDAKAGNPTFFTLWIGNNDVLGYALSGGEGALSGLGSGDITPVDTFQNAINRIVDALTSNGAKGAIGNMPDVTSIPFFTTIPFNGLHLVNQTEVDSLNNSYAVYNTSAIALGLPKIEFSLGDNAYVIEDNVPPYNTLGGIRQIKQGELICLNTPQDSLKCGRWGSNKKIPASYVLDATEIQNCKSATATFNTILQSKASAKGLAFADFNAYFKTFQSGIIFNGVKYTPEFVKGGTFSLDGVHPNMRGYALIANYWIQSINAKFGSNIPQVDVNAYPGVKFP